MEQLFQLQSIRIDSIQAHFEAEAKKPADTLQNAQGHLATIALARGKVVQRVEPA